ncbi:hypothetical protein ACN27F_07100 [Solwaraspora sp. WMMB335]|uniref:nSTAND1 domain-containing NTPase n=1 Tax=Solwaraspora sp. WMMB335 TaxID=3404118 RepID=UPI003B958E4C
MSNQDGVNPAERARQGVRDWIRDITRRTGRGLLNATPYGILAFLTASAVAPIAAAGFTASGVVAAALEQLGQLGGGYLADVLSDTARRLRGRRLTDAQWREALAEELLCRLSADDPAARALRAEAGQLLQAVGAVQVALAEAAENDVGLRDELATAFQVLSHDVAALQWMIVEAHRALGELQRQLAERSHEQRVEMDRLHRQLLTITQLTVRFEQPAVLPAVLPTAQPAAQPAAVAEPGTATGTEPGDGAQVCPFPGLAAFQPGDAPWFHGRDEQVAQVLSRLVEQSVGGPPLVITGVSGAGKSSLLRAGVLPAIAGGALGDAGQWRWLLMTPGPDPLGELVERTLAAYGRPAADPSAQIARDSPPEFGGLAAAAAAAAGDGGAAGATVDAGVRLVIAVDQFEQLFTQCPDPAGRLAFVTALASAAPAVVVITVRADFYADCAELPPLAQALAAGHLMLGRLTAEQLRRAVREPAARAGLEVEPGLVELLLADLGATDPGGYDPGALPLLGHALRATWERRDGQRLTVAGYHATGGIRRAIAATAEQIYLQLDPAGRAELRTAMLHLVTLTDAGTVVRRRGDRRLLEAGLLARLVRARLVTAAADTVEISHEALLTNWPRLVSWLSEARDELTLRQRLVVAADDWQAAGRDPDLLLRGSRLAEARRWSAGRADLATTQVDYLDASTVAAEAAESARQRGVRRLRRLAAGLAVALLLAVVGGLSAVDKQAEAERQRRQATSRQYAAESLVAGLSNDDLLAMRKALSAWDQAPTMEAYSALIGVQSASMVGPLGTGPGGLTAALSPDGTLVAVGHQDGTIRLWDTGSLRPRDVVLHHSADDPVVSLAFSPDGRYLASGSFTADGGLRIWAAASGAAVRDLPGAGAVAWLPGTSTVLASRIGTDLTPPLQVGGWDATSGELRLALPTGMLGYDLSVSPDGALVALANPADGDVQVWRLTDRTRVRTLPSAQQVAFAPDGMLVTGDVDGGLASWSVRTGERTPLATGPQRPPVPLAVTPDGTLLTLGGWSAGRVDGWALSTGVVKKGYSGYAGRIVSDITLSADGRTIAVTGPDAPTMLFRRSDGLLPHPEAVQYAAVAPAGDRLVTAAGDGVVRIWDLASREPLPPIRPDAAGTTDAAITVTGVAVAVDGTIAVATHDAGVLRYTATGAPAGTLPVAGGTGWQVRHPVFSPDGDLLAAAVSGPGPDGAESDGVVVWPLDRPDEQVFLPTDGTTTALAFAPDAATLVGAVAVGQASTAEVTLAAQLRSWQVDDLSPGDELTIPGRQVLDLAVSPDGRLVAVAGDDRRVELRGTANFELVRTLPVPVDVVANVAFSPDGRHLATSAVGDELLRLWEVDTGRLAAVLLGHLDDVNEVAFTSDGQLLSASTDTTAQVLDLDAQRVADRICAGVGAAAVAVGDPLPRVCDEASRPG